MHEQVEQTKFSSKHPLIRLVIESYKRDLLRLIEKTKPQTILDAGCGEGIISGFVLKNIHADMYGADYSVQMLKRTLGIMPVICANIEKLPFIKRSFDLCLCLEVLEHTENPAVALAELARVGNKSIVSVPNDTLMRLGNLSRGKYVESWGNFPGHINHFGPASFKKLLEKNFFVEEYKVSGCVWLLALLRPKSS